METLPQLGVAEMEQTLATARTIAVLGECKLQAAYRNWSHEAARHTTIGFRLCIPRA
jgi:hypothetical protein